MNPSEITPSKNQTLQKSQNSRDIPYSEKEKIMEDNFLSNIEKIRIQHTSKNQQMMKEFKQTFQLMKNQFQKKLSQLSQGSKIQIQKWLLERFESHYEKKIVHLAKWLQERLESNYEKKIVHLVKWLQERLESHYQKKIVFLDAKIVGSQERLEFHHQKIVGLEQKIEALQKSKKNIEENISKDSKKISEIKKNKVRENLRQFIISETKENIAIQKDIFTLTKEIKNNEHSHPKFQRFAIDLQIEKGMQYSFSFEIMKGDYHNFGIIKKQFLKDESHHKNGKSICWKDDNIWYSKDEKIEQKAKQLLLQGMTLQIAVNMKNHTVNFIKNGEEDLLTCDVLKESDSHFVAFLQMSQKDSSVLCIPE